MGGLQQLMANNIVYLSSKPHLVALKRQEAGKGCTHVDGWAVGVTMH